MTRQFLLTLKTPIRVQQSRLDGSPIILKSATLQVEWPLSDYIEDACAASTCGHKDIETCRKQLKTVEAPLVNVTVTNFVVGDDRGFWQSPTQESSCEPFEIQLKRDNVLSRQSVS